MQLGSFLGFSKTNRYANVGLHHCACSQTLLISERTRSSSVFCWLDLCWGRQCVQMAKRGAYICLLFLQGIAFNTSARPPFAGFSQDLLFPPLHHPTKTLAWAHPPFSPTQFILYRFGVKLKTTKKHVFIYFIIGLIVLKSQSQRNLKSTILFTVNIWPARSRECKILLNKCDLHC